MRPRLVVCAAIRSNETGKIITGARHFDTIMRTQVSAANHVGSPDEWGRVEQGFIDQKGVFMTREEAWKVAEAAGQIKYPLGHSEGTLYSECLY